MIFSKVVVLYINIKCNPIILLLFFFLNPPNCYLMCYSSCGLQVEQRAAKNGHEAEVFELKHQLSRLSHLVEKANQALQQKTQVRMTFAGHLLSSIHL